MNLKSFSKLAAVSAVALGTAMYGTGVFAAAFQIGDPILIGIDAAVENSLTVTVTDIDLGTIGSMNDDTDTATLDLDPITGLTTEDPGTGFGGTDPASIVFDPSDPPVRGLIAVTGAFESTDLYATYDTCDNVDTATAGVNNFLLISVGDNMGDAGLPAGAPIANGEYDCVGLAMVSTGQATTTVGGALSFNVGATIQTDPAEGDGAYVDDPAYSGGINLYLSY